jgi:hypothetical protein
MGSPAPGKTVNLLIARQSSSKGGALFCQTASMELKAVSASLEKIAPVRVVA